MSTATLPSAHVSNGATAPAPRMSKVGAVRAAQKAGHTTLDEIRTYARNVYGLEITSNDVANAKAPTVKGGGKKPGRRGRAPKAPILDQSTTPRVPAENLSRYASFSREVQDAIDALSVPVVRQIVTDITTKVEEEARRRLGMN